MENIVLTNISIDELADRIAEKLLISEAKNHLNSGKKEEKEYLSITEASELIGLAVPTIYGLTHNYQIPHFKKSRKLWFKRSELLEWLDSGRKLTKIEIEKEAIQRIRAIRNK